MSSQLRASVGIALALALLPMSSEAAGLGRLNLLSALGQPLRAEIDLTSVSREEAGSLVARLAGSDAFSQANIEYGAALASLRFSIQRRANGQAYVQVTSTQPVNEPYLDMLVELSWNSGRLVREYTMLLDPPELRTARRGADTVAPVVPAIPVPAPRASRGDAPGAGRAGAASVAAATSAASTGSGASAGGDYQVRRGDTASAIARTNRPEGASLEQMLAALYRNNPQAFDGNINRLKAGAILRIPDAGTATGVDRAEAQRFVNAQTADFSGYRSRLARAASETPVQARGAGREASGKLSTRVDETGGPAAANKDQLRLSKAEAQKNADSVTASGTRGGKAPAVSGPASEELVVKDRALQEANTRVALLEKTVADLQKLVELKNQNLAELQKQAQKSGQPVATDNASQSPAAASSAAPATAPAAAPASPAATATPDLPPPPVVVAPAPAPAPATPQASVPAPTPAPVAAPKAAAPAADERSWIDAFRANPLMLGALALLVVLIVGYVLYSVQRRRKFSRFEDSILTGASALRTNSVFGTTGGQSVDTSNSGFHSNFVPIAGATPEHNEVDPVAEADVYIAYGRDAQAEEILKESLRAHPERHAVRLKLLEIHAKRGDAKSFETVASEMYAMTGGQGAEWKQAAALGATIDQANPLYRDAPSPESSPIGTQQATTDFDRTRALPALDAAALGAMGLTGAAALAAVGEHASPAPGPAPKVDSRFMRTVASDALPLEDMTRTDPLPKVAETASTTSPAMDLDFDLGFGSASQRGATHAGRPESAVPAAVEHRPGSSAQASHGLDFDFGAPRIDTPDPLPAPSARDSSMRTAVELPAFRSQPEPLLDAPAFAAPHADAGDGFTASDIFGSSMSAHTEPAPDVSHTAPPTPVPHVQEYAQFDKTEPFDALSGISLDLDSGTFGKASHTVSDPGARTDAWQAITTKLDLAAAYRDIGDVDGARELLEEVIKSGDAAQVDQARRLIGELG